MTMLNGRRQIILFVALLVFPTTTGAQQPSLSAAVPPPGETSSITTLQGGEKMTTWCRTDTQHNTVCINRSYQIGPSMSGPPPVSPLVREELARNEELRESAWESYCQPTLYVGRDGLTRYRYARANCDAVVLSGKSPRTPWAND